MARKPKTERLSQVGATGNLSHDPQNSLTDEQQQVLFFNHKGKIAALKDKVAKATSDLRNAYKLAKSEGFPKKDFDFAFMLEKDEDDTASSERRRQAEIARWMNHPIGTQADLFDADKATAPSQEERGYAEGKRAGLANEICKPPFDAGTDGYDGYMRGWHEGNAVRVNMANEQKVGDSILLRTPGNEPASADDFDSASEGQGRDPKWPDDAQVEARETEPA